MGLDWLVLETLDLGYLPDLALILPLESVLRVLSVCLSNLLILNLLSVCGTLQTCVLSLLLLELGLSLSLGL